MPAALPPTARLQNPWLKPYADWVKQSDMLGHNRHRRNRKLLRKRFLHLVLLEK
jgi:hypothetical protein